MERRRRLSAATVLIALMSMENRLWSEDARPKAERFGALTGAAEPLGTTAMTVNGVVTATGEPARYHFEYGLTPQYGQQTPAAELPPRLAAYYRETWDAGLGGWQGGMSGKDLASQAAGGAQGGFVRFAEPSGNDPNHVDGIGTLHLCKYMYPGPLLGAYGSSLQLGGGEPDFRDARIAISVRGNQWQPNGSELVWWTQSQKNIEVLYDASWRRANWAYTGFSLTDALRSGRWETVEYRLWNDSTQWSYGGNNLAQQRPNYVHWSINESQRRLNNDFFHLLAFVDPKKLPQGSIDFDELTVTYRNASLLAPFHGASLAREPAGGEASAKTLTDGWRHGVGKMWRSGEKPGGPQEFAWDFARPVTIETVQIHQHPQWPSKSVELLVSADGKEFSPVRSLEMPASSPLGPNFLFALSRLPKPVEARSFKLVISSGHQAERWGLGEVELFGRGARYATEPGANHLNADISGLTPGKTYHYRLVATLDTGATAAGGDATFTVPDSTRPFVVTGGATRVASAATRLEGRLTPMGLKTMYWFEYGLDANYGQKTDEVYGGLQITPRAAFVEISGLKPGSKVHYRLAARNETGTSYGADATVQLLAR